MNAEQVHELYHGLYRLYWKDGGSSLACVGSLHNGDRWFACTNWTSHCTHGIASTKWDLVERAELIERAE